MVWSLEEIQDVEDLQLLSGHIYMILGNLDKAQVCLTLYAVQCLKCNCMHIFYTELGLLFEIFTTRNSHRYAHGRNGMGTSSAIS